MFAEGDVVCTYVDAKKRRAIVLRVVGDDFLIVAPYHGSPPPIGPCEVVLPSSQAGRALELSKPTHFWARVARVRAEACDGTPARCPPEIFARVLALTGARR